MEFDTGAVLECDTGCLRGAGGLDQGWSLIQEQCWSVIQAVGAGLGAGAELEFDTVAVLECDTGFLRGLEGTRSVIQPLASDPTNLSRQTRRNNPNSTQKAKGPTPTN